MEILAGLGFWTGALLCLPCGFLMLEVLLGLGPSRPLRRSSAPPRAVLLIPAHNEGTGMAETLNRLAQTGTEGVRVIVVADNCADETARIAREAGAEVFERNDPELRGKPHALQWALKKLEADPPDVVVFLDADCWFRSGSPRLLALQAAAEMRPIQCIYLMEGTGLGAFAFRMRNEARLRGLHALGAPVQITGSGFAIPLSLIQRVPVPLGELAEDAVWGWFFCREGAGVKLATDSVVGSAQAGTVQDAGVQRRRWEHGILSAVLKHLPSLCRSAFLPPRWRRILHLLDVLIPPLALLALMLVVSLTLGLASGSLTAMIPALSALGLLAAAVLIGWSAYGRAYLPLSKLLLTPVYVLKKIGLYVSFLFKRERSWIRTGRDPGE
jgi:cellulose synthase/poly-beta-1,6-N-acetylglucosamine synthase-like glycosyltransferase